MLLFYLILAATSSKFTAGANNQILRNWVLPCLDPMDESCNGVTLSKRPQGRQLAQSLIENLLLSIDVRLTRIQEQKKLLAALNADARQKLRIEQSYILTIKELATIFAALTERLPTPETSPVDSILDIADLTDVFGVGPGGAVDPEDETDSTPEIDFPNLTSIFGVGPGGAVPGSPAAEIAEQNKGPEDFSGSSSVFGDGIETSGLFEDPQGSAGSSSTFGAINPSIDTFGESQVSTFGSGDSTANTDPSADFGNTASVLGVSSEGDPQNQEPPVSPIFERRNLIRKHLAKLKSSYKPYK